MIGAAIAVASLFLNFLSYLALCSSPQRGVGKKGFKITNSFKEE